MKSVKTWKLWALLLAVCLCAQSADSWATNPSISFEHEMEDLGQVSGGQKLTVRFPYSNAGDGNLVLQDVRADCGCTQVSGAGREVPPHAGSEIVAVLDTTGAPGRKERHIHVRSNDPLRPVVILTLVVEVMPEHQ